MKIAIIGASAGIGLEATRIALQRGHEVTTLSRQIVPLPDHAKLQRVQGSATNPSDVRPAVEGAEAILVTLGVKSPFPTRLFSDSAHILLRALRETHTSAARPRMIHQPQIGSENGERKGVERPRYLIPPFGD